MKNMIIAGALCGALICAAGGAILWRSNKNNSGAPIAEKETPDIAEPTMVDQQSELFFGGRKVVPYFRFVALYGNPDYPMLGSLGEQTLEQSVIRLNTLVSSYQPISEQKVVPTFEIIATVASAGPTENNDYSQEVEITKLKTWIEFAEINNIYVVLDLQPGRSTFLEQSKIFEELLKSPNVGLALDPEWRLQTSEDRHLKKIGSVSAEEINQTSDWLADLVKINELPQKLFIIHQFKISMITSREAMRTIRPELAYVVHMDGHGELGQKIDTWNTLLLNMPANIRMGWKNFYDEDKPTPTPEQTMSQAPAPLFISYQ